MLFVFLLCVSLRVLVIVRRLTKWRRAVREAVEARSAGPAGVNRTSSSLSSSRLQDASPRRLRSAPRDSTSRRELTPRRTVREHFSSPLLQYAAADGGRTFVLVECPSAPPRSRPNPFAA
jgi:hypothetical protein